MPVAIACSSNRTLLFPPAGGVPRPQAPASLDHEDGAHEQVHNCALSIHPRTLGM